MLSINITSRYLRATHVPFMTKALSKAIMKRPGLETKYLNYLTLENRTKYNKSRKKFVGSFMKKR